MENLLFGLLTKDKKDKSQESAIYAEWKNDNDLFLYKPMEKPLAVNAVVYTRFSSARAAERFLEYEREKGIQYCDLQGYNLLLMLESVGKNGIEEDTAMNKIMELAEKGLIDVVVFPTISGLTRNWEDMFWVLDRLYMYKVKVDWVGCGNLDKAIFKAYIEESEKQEQEFARILKTFVCESRCSGKRR